MLVYGMNGTLARDGEEQAEFAVRELARIRPASRKRIEATQTHDWGKSYAEGAYAHYAPGPAACGERNY